MRFRAASFLVSALLILATIPSDGRAQATEMLGGPQAAGTSVEGFAPLLHAAHGDAPLAPLNTDLRRRTRPTYWLTGGLIGGVALGALGAIAGAGLCADDESNPSTGTCILAGVGGTVVLGGIGFTVGALIGGLFPKAQAASSEAP